MFLHVKLTLITSLILFTLEIKCDCEQRSFPSAEVRICAGKCVYQTIQGCVDADYFIGDVTEVSFINTKIPSLRRATFKNMVHLKSVHTQNTGIKRIYPGVFYNSPEILRIDFNFNHIEEIPWGVFNNMSFEEVVMSWNNISYIENEAFSHMPNLKTVHLTRNQIGDYDKQWFKNTTNLKVLNLSYNKISKIWPWSFDTFPNLAYLDLSFNEIFEFGAQSFNNVKRLNLLDLTRNNLTAIKADIFTPGIIVKELRIPLNKLSFLSEKILESGSVQSIALNPNPWQCPCLDRVFKWAGEHNMTILQPSMDHRIIWNPDLPVCALRRKDSNVCLLTYDDEFLSTQEEYFKQVYYANAVREKPTSEPPNFDVINVDNTFANLSAL